MNERRHLPEVVAHVPTADSFLGQLVTPSFLFLDGVFQPHLHRQATAQETQHPQRRGGIFRISPAGDHDDATTSIDIVRVLWQPLQKLLVAEAHALGVGEGHVEEVSQDLLGGMDGLAAGEIPMWQPQMRFGSLEQMFEMNPTLPDLPIVGESGGNPNGIAGRKTLG